MASSGLHMSSFFTSLHRSHSTGIRTSFPKSSSRGDATTSSKSTYLLTHRILTVSRAQPLGYNSQRIYATTTGTISKPKGAHKSSKATSARKPITKSTKRIEPELTPDETMRLYRESKAIEMTPISDMGGIRSHKISLSSSKANLIEKEFKSGRSLLNQERIKINERILPTVVIDNINAKYGADRMQVSAAVRPSNATDSDQVRRAQVIAQQLSIPYFDTVGQMKRSQQVDFALIIGKDHISLANMEELNSPSIFSDFIAGSTAHRKETGGSQTNTPIIKAATISGKSIGETHVVDATGGLGVDTFMFASAGFRVTVLEKNPLVFTLLSDALQRAKQVSWLKTVTKRIELVHIDAEEWFAEHAGQSTAPDVIYLDPMYPIESKMKAAPKKGMAIARALIGKNDTADLLVRSALTCAKERVVLKRPWYTVDSAGILTKFKSRSLRFEVFTNDSWRSAGPEQEVRVPTPSKRLQPL